MDKLLSGLLNLRVKNTRAFGEVGSLLKARSNWRKENTALTEQIQDNAAKIVWAERRIKTLIFGRNGHANGNGNGHHKKARRKISNAKSLRQCVTAAIPTTGKPVTVTEIMKAVKRMKYKTSADDRTFYRMIYRTLMALKSVKRIKPATFAASGSK